MTSDRTRYLDPREFTLASILRSLQKTSPDFSVEIVFYRRHDGHWAGSSTDTYPSTFSILCTRQGHHATYCVAQRCKTFTGSTAAHGARCTDDIFIFPLVKTNDPRETLSQLQSYFQSFHGNEDCLHRYRPDYNSTHRYMVDAAMPITCIGSTKESGHDFINLQASLHPYTSFDKGELNVFQQADLLQDTLNTAMRPRKHDEMGPAYYHQDFAEPFGKIFMEDVDTFIKRHDASLVAKVA